jgi:hypothetical protein
MNHPEKNDSKLEFLRTALLLDQTLFTVQRQASRKGQTRVDCFVSKGEGSLGLTRITSPAARALEYHRNGGGLTISDSGDIGRNLAAALSSKLGFALKHERLNSNGRCNPVSFFY